LLRVIAPIIGGVFASFANSPYREYA